MSNYLALRSSATPAFTVSTLTGSTITAKAISYQSTVISLGQSTNQTYTNFTSGAFTPALMTSTLSTYNSLSTVTKVSMSQDGRYQYALQSVPSTSAYYQLSRSSDTGVTWSTLNTSTMGLPQGSLAYQSTVSGYPTYSNISQSATGQYALAATSGGQLYVSNNANSATPVYTPANVGGAPYAYLPMDSLPITDMMGNTTITVTGSAPLVAGKVGSAINLANTAGGTATNYVTGTWTGATNFTVSFWFRTLTAGAAQVLMGAYNILFNITVDGTNVLRLYIPSGINTNTLAATGPTISINTWYNVVAIFQTGGTCSLYVNGTFYGSSTNSGALPSFTQFTLGTYGNGTVTNAFSGYIDDFYIYNFAAPNVVPPYIYLPLDGNVVDAMGNTTITPVNSPGYVMGAPIGTRALSLANPTYSTTTPQYIGGTWTGSSSFTVTGRFNLQSYSSVTAQMIFSAGSTGYDIFIDSTSGNNAICANFQPTNTRLGTSSFPALLNTWYSFTYIFQTGGLCSFYVNNTLIGSGTAPSTGLAAIGGFRFGTHDAALQYIFNGYFDDIRIYNYAITVSPIVPMNWSHTAVSATGQYMMAAAAAGGVFYSTNYGATWSQLTTTQIPSIVAPGGAAKTLMGPLIQPNSTAATSATWSVNGVTWTATASTTYSTLYPYNAFNNSGSGTWGSAGTYNVTTGAYTGSVSTSIVGLSAAAGEYLQIQTSIPVVIYSYSFASGGAPIQMPKIYYIIGSNDGLTWYPIHYMTMTGNNAFTSANRVATSYLIINQSGSQTLQGDQAGVGTVTTYSTTPNTYIYFRLITTNTWTTTSSPSVEIGEWYVNFSTPMPLLTAPATAPSTATSAVTVTPQMTNLTAPNAITTWSTPNGVMWTASATSTYTGNNPINYPGLAFNGLSTTTQSWASGTANYNSGTGIAQTTNTYMSAVYSTSGTINIRGEALQLQSSVPLIMTSYSYGCEAYAYAPKTYYILGSNDGITWYNLQSASTPTNPFGTTNNTALTTYITVNYTGTQPLSSAGAASTTTTTTATQYSTNAYTYFRFIADSVYSGNIFQVGEWYINFTAYTPNPVNALAISNGGQNMLVAATGTTMPNSTAATAASWTANGVTWNALASSNYQTLVNLPQYAFNTLIGNGTINWGSVSTSYNTTTGAYTGAFTGANATTVQGGVGAVAGEYLQLQSSVPLVMYSYSFASGNVAPAIPKTYIIVGSTDGTTWYPIHSMVMTGSNAFTTTNKLATSYLIINQSGSQTLQGDIAGVGTVTTYSTTTNAYTYFRLIGQTVWPLNGGPMEFGEWLINFQYGSTYLSTNYGSTWSTAATAPPTAPFLTTSGNGTYTITGSGQLATVYSNAALTTYTIPTLTGINANINCASVSSTGQYMIIMTQGTTNNVFYSTNYGVTFTAMTVGTLPMTSCAMSYDGFEITVSNASTVYTLNRNTQGYAITMGNQSGVANQGYNSVAIGNLAGVTNQSANSIILNASGSVLDAYNPGFFVSPVQSQLTANQSSVALLGYGADSQVVQTGPSVKTDGSFNPFVITSMDTGVTAGSALTLTNRIGSAVTFTNSLGQGFYNSIVQAGDFGIINRDFMNSTTAGYFTNSALATGGICIASHSNSSSGIRVNPLGVQMNGNVGIGFSSSSYPLAIQGTQAIYGLSSQASIATGSGNLLLYTNQDTYAYPTISLFNYNHDNNAILFDLFFNSAGWANSTTGTGYGLYKSSNTLKVVYYTGTAGVGGVNIVTGATFNSSGGLAIAGALSKNSGTFDIEHPLYPGTKKRLCHSFVEGPRCDLIYRGSKTLVAGQAIIDINKECTFRPEDAMDHGTFEALCANPDVFLQNRTGFARVIGSVTAGTLTITCENASSSDTISWMVVAERKDPFIKKWERTDADGYLITQYEGEQV